MSQYQRKLPPLDPCPLEYVLEIVGGRWKGRLLHRLSLGDATAGALRRAVPRARAQVVLLQLRALENDGMIARKEPELGQVWGRYTLTQRGHAMLGALEPIVRWGEREGGCPRPPAVAAERLKPS